MQASQRTRRSGRRGFTLVEVLVTVAIIGLLTAMFLGALAASQEQAREARTKTMISRLDTVMMSRWESYRTRRLPANTSGLGPGVASMIRLSAMHDLQRMELPQRWDDITQDATAWPNALSVDTSSSGSGSGIAVPALSLSYLRRFNSNTVNGVQVQPTDEFQASECLYLVITSGALEEDVSPIDQFRSMDVGDFDRDGMNEFHDGWGYPITWIRWPTNFPSDVQPDLTPIIAAGDTVIRAFCVDRHDPLDPARLDLPGNTLTNGAGSATRPTTLPCGYRLSPLIVSAGPDGEYDVMRGSSGSDPYYWPTTAGELPGGTPLTTTTNPLAQGSYLDNIHNHQLGAQAR